MAGLLLKLRAGERILINGAALENLQRPSRLRVLTPETDVLRLRDAVDPEAVETPVGRLAHLIQMIVAGLVSLSAAQDEIALLLRGLHEALIRPDDLALLRGIEDELVQGRPYHALRRVRQLMTREADLLAGAPA